MSYQVHITSAAEPDIIRAADHIEFTLKNPDAANPLLDTVALASLLYLIGHNRVCECRVYKYENKKRQPKPSLSLYYMIQFFIAKAFSEIFPYYLLFSLDRKV